MASPKSTLKYQTGDRTVFLLFCPSPWIGRSVTAAVWATQSASHNRCIEFLQSSATKDQCADCEQAFLSRWTLSKQTATAQHQASTLPGSPSKVIHNSPAWHSKWVETEKPWKSICWGEWKGICSLFNLCYTVQIVWYFEEWPFCY